MIRISIPRRLLSFLLLILLLWSVPVLAAGRANMFIYHRFGETRYPSTNIPPEIFAEQLDLLRRQSVKVMPLGEVARLVAAGKPLPEHAAVLSVDDAFRSFLTGGWPLLQKYQFPVSLFVTTAFVGRPGYLNWDELRRLRDAGVELGNHTDRHLHLVKRLEGETEAAWRKRIDGELSRSQEVFRREIGYSPELFAYPYGEYQPELQPLLIRHGFIAAVAQQSGVVTGLSDRWALPRFPMGGVYASLAGFRDKLQMNGLPLKVLAPPSPLLAETGAPVLEVEIDTRKIDLRQLRCYVPGQPPLTPVALNGQLGHYRIQATQPLQGRRSKYTLTAPGKNGGWYWFSQLWIRPWVAESDY